MAHDEKQPGGSDEPILPLDDDEMFEIGPDTVVQLSPQGRFIWQQFLGVCSAHAGRDVKGEEVTAIMRRIRKETGIDDPQFTDPKVMEMFKQYLREPRRQ